MCTICVRVAALRAAQNALAGQMRPAGRSLPTSVFGYKRASLYCMQAKMSCSWVKLIDIFHKAH